MIVNRRQFFSTAGAWVASSGIRAAAPGRPPIVAVLTPAPASAISGYVDQVVEALREQGWEHGRNVTVERRFGDGTPASIDGAIEELAGMRVDVVVVGNTYAAVALRRRSPTTPIVIALGTDPIGLGLVDSYRRPGGQVTGLAWDQTPEVTAKYPELLKEAVPGLSRLGCLIDPRYPGITTYRRVLEAACVRLGVVVTHREIGRGEDVGPAFESLDRERIQALYVYGSTVSLSAIAQIVAQARRRRLPDLHVFKEAIAAGALMYFGPSILGMYRRTAYYVARILEGAAPGELPMELPSKYEFVINGRTARELGLKLPQSLLLRADEVVG
jgi:putative ABC transport system substrate-binding protein